MEENKKVLLNAVGEKRKTKHQFVKLFGGFYYFRTCKTIKNIKPESVYRLTVFSAFLFVFLYSCQKHKDPPPNNPQPVFSNEKSITTFSFLPEDNASLNAIVNGVISNDTIQILFPYGTALTGLKPTIGFKGETVSPANKTAKDFTNALEYTVTAEDGTTTKYIVLAKTEPLPATLYFLSTSPGTHTALNPAKLWVVDANTGLLKWTYASPTDSLAWNGTYANGLLYFVFGTGIVAFDALSHTIKWEYKTKRLIWSTPTVVDGRVYINSDDQNLYCIDALSGSLYWKYSQNNDNPLRGGGNFSSPTVVDGVVYFGSIDRYIYAVDALTGTLKWKTLDSYQSISLNALPTTGPSVVNNTLYIGDEYGGMLALNTSNGSIKWKFKANGIIYSSPTVVDGVVYFGSQDKNLYALDAATGVVKWQFAAGAPLVVSPFVANGFVYFGTADQPFVLYSVDASNGLVKWGVATTDAISSPLVYNNNVYVGTRQSINAFDASTGALKWKMSTDNANDMFYPLSPFIVDQNGTTFFPTESGNKN